MAIHLYTNVDNGYLHIAADEKYQGCISLYNNWFTKLAAKIFGISEDVCINQEIYTVNKREYIQLLNSVGVAQATQKTIGVYRNFNLLQIVPQNKGFMREHISTEKTHELGKRLIDAITKGEIEVAEKLLGNGACPDEKFSWNERTKKFMYGWDFEKTLPRDAIPIFKEYTVTPLLHAAYLQDFSLRNLLLQFGADHTIPGEEHMFSREELERTSSIYDIPVMRTVRSHLKPRVGILLQPNYFYKNSYRLRNYGVSPQIVPTIEFHQVIKQKPGIDREISELRKFRDVWSNVLQFQYNKDTETLEFGHIPQQRTRQWEERKILSRIAIA